MMIVPVATMHVIMSTKQGPDHSPAQPYTLMLAGGNALAGSSSWGNCSTSVWNSSDKEEEGDSQKKHRPPMASVSCCLVEKEFACMLVGGKALAGEQQLGGLQDERVEESSDEEDEDSENMPSPSNNFSFPPDTVARFQEGYRSSPGAAMEAMRKTYVRHPILTTPPTCHSPACMQKLAGPGLVSLGMMLLHPQCLSRGEMWRCAGVAEEYRRLQHAGAAAAVLP